MAALGTNSSTATLADRVTFPTLCEAKGLSSPRSGICGLEWTNRMTSVATDLPSDGWRSSRARSVALRALLVALLCWLPASYLSARGIEVQGAQVIARMLVAFSPIWLLMIWLLVTRYRSAVAALAIASTGMVLSH
jgi:hypothetical protein